MSVFSVLACDHEGCRATYHPQNPDARLSFLLLRTDARFAGWRSERDTDWCPVH